MTHPFLSRAHLEALLVAIAIVRPERRAELLERVDRDRITPACWAMLAQLADPAVEAIQASTRERRVLADHVDAITVADLTLWPDDTVLALVNALPERYRPAAAWERDLAVAEASAA